MSQPTKKILILSVDKDNDIGRATGLSTPIIGRDRVASAANIFATKTPEDSDVNAVFAAMNTYDSLQDQGFVCEVALIAGKEQGGFESDLKITSDLDSILSQFKANSVIFVSDGASDEQVIPTIVSKIPIISVRRVFVQQEKSVEETYVLLARYFKKLAEPQYARLALGIPGVIIIAMIGLYYLDLLYYAVLALGIIIGAVLIIKGFAMDRYVKDAWDSSPIKLISAIIATLICSVSLYRGISIALNSAPPSESAARFISQALLNTMDLFTLGLAIYIMGSLVVKYLDDSPKLWHEIVGVVALIFIRQMVIDLAPIIENPQGNIIPFLFTAGLGAIVCAILVVIFTLTPRVRKKVTSRSGGKPLQ
jgi:putative membrane protein